jgi:hypothetical protein
MSLIGRQNRIFSAAQAMKANPRRHRIDHMTGGLQVLDQQPFRGFHRDRELLTEPGQLGVQVAQSGDVMG